MQRTHVLGTVGGVTLVVLGGYAAHFFGGFNTRVPPETAQVSAAQAGGSRYVLLPQANSNVDAVGTGGYALLQSKLQGLQNEITALKTGLAALRKELKEQAHYDQPPQTTVDDTDQEIVAREMGDINTAVALAEERRREQMAVFEGAFQREVVDTHWSAQATTLIDEAMANKALSGTSVMASECRSNLCRLGVSHADPKAASDFELLFPMQVGQSLPQATYYHEQLADGRTDTVIYLARDGYTMP